MKNSILLAVFIFCLLKDSKINAQYFWEEDLDKAFIKAKSTNKKVLIFRYDSSYSSLTEKPKIINFTYVLLTLLEKNEFYTNISKEYIIVKAKVSLTKTKYNNFIDSFLRNSSANFIVTEANKNIVGYLNFSYFEDTSRAYNIINELKDNIKTNKENVIKRNKLEAKYISNTISKDELYELIKLRFSFNLRINKHINRYALFQGKMNLAFSNLILQEEYETSDPIVKYFLNTERDFDYNWRSNQNLFLDNLVITAVRKINKKEFELAIKIKEKHLSNFYKKYPTALYNLSSIPLKPLIQDILNEKFDFYWSINDTNNVLRYGGELAIFILKAEAADKDKRVVKASKLFITKDSIGKKDSTIFSDKEYKILKELYKEDEEEIPYYISSMVAEPLNRVAWAYYLFTKNRTFLKKALEWSSYCIEFNKEPYYLNTHAHLLFALGDKEKALFYMENAIKSATERGFYESGILELKKNLEKLQRSKTPNSY